MDIHLKSEVYFFMKKVKLNSNKTRESVGLTVNINPELYERLSQKAIDLKISKKILIMTGIEKILDDIDAYGVEL